MSSVALFGAAALGNVTQAEADATLDLLLEYGVNHIDTAASYGEAELRIGPWMPKHRKAFFLATKTGERTYAAAREEIRRSLERLQTDHVDLIQLHNLVHPDEWDMAMSDGALRAAVEARDEGLTRFIGITGHGLTVAAQHLRALARFDFDSVLCPYNYPTMADGVYGPDFEKLYVLCRERNIAVQTIKTITRGPWGTTARNRATWYEPLEEQADIDTAVHWAMGKEGVFLNTVGDIHLLPKVLDAASRFTVRPADEQVAEMAKRLRMSSLFVS
ncbi:MAG: aldo/keto reductase [Caldilineaceae bacterium]|nr:aldo/keto reductase [Caldilineaceae bacterium]MBP8109614.1 aldo/keto reductase [Caldilineaceae bacterium]MBP8124496.1 aldo/keto reductase [Caldilineaceae bacterium]MBP9074173.1 aldo/keto reductase [Caldilineaceae bacterium]